MEFHYVSWPNPLYMVIFIGYVKFNFKAFCTKFVCSKILPILWSLKFQDSIFFRATSWFQWPFQEPKLEVPTIYKAYFSGLCFREDPHKIWPNRWHSRTNPYRIQARSTVDVDPQVSPCQVEGSVQERAGLIIAVAGSEPLGRTWLGRRRGGCGDSPWDQKTRKKP